jgi:hypothetical protein
MQGSTNMSYSRIEGWLRRQLNMVQAPHEANLIVPAAADVCTSGFDEALESFQPLSSNWFGIGDRFFR